MDYLSRLISLSFYRPCLTLVPKQACAGYAQIISSVDVTSDESDKAVTGHMA